MIDEIYLHLVEHIKDQEYMFAQNNFAAPAHYDLYNQQPLRVYSDEEQGHPFLMPALFFEFDIDYEDMGHNAQKGKGRLRLHVTQEDYAWSADSSSDQQDALAVLRYLNTVNKCLHGQSIAQSFKLYRRKLLTDQEATNVKNNIIEYEFEFEDNSTNVLNDLILAEDTDLNTSKQLVSRLEPEKKSGTYNIPE